MINKATILGKIGKIDSKTLKNGEQLTTLSVATSRKWIDTFGHQQQLTTWHVVNFFNKLAGITLKFAKVGALAYIEGEICNKKVEYGDKQGQFLYSITGHEFKVMPSAIKQVDNDDIGNEK